MFKLNKKGSANSLKRVAGLFSPKGKKGVELPITAIVIFVILLVVAVVVIVIFVRKTGTGAEQLASCGIKTGRCSNELGSGTDCPSGYVSLGVLNCKQGTDEYKCCLATTG